MQLKQQIQQELHEALRMRDQKRVDVIRMLLAAFEQAQESMGKQAFETAGPASESIQPDRHQILSEQAIEDILRNEVQRRREAVAILRAGRQTKRVKSEEAEIAILEGYLARA